MLLLEPVCTLCVVRMTMGADGGAVGGTAGPIRGVPSQRFHQPALCTVLCRARLPGGPRPAKRDAHPVQPTNHGRRSVAPLSLAAGLWVFVLQDCTQPRKRECLHMGPDRKDLGWTKFDDWSHSRCSGARASLCAGG